MAHLPELILSIIIITLEGPIYHVAFMHGICSMYMRLTTNKVQPLFYALNKQSFDGFGGIGDRTQYQKVSQLVSRLRHVQLRMVRFLDRHSSCAHFFVAVIFGDLSRLSSVAPNRIVYNYAMRL